MELIVIVGIIGLLSALMFSGERQNSEQRKMALEIQQLSQEMRRMQNSALSSSQATQCGNNVVAYGIYFQTVAPSQYISMADCDGDRAYDSGESIKIIKLDATSLSSLQTGAGAVASLAIIFVPPQPDVAINGDTTTAGRSGAIQLCLTGRSVCKSITVNSKGVISSQ